MSKINNIGVPGVASEVLDKLHGRNGFLDNMKLLLQCSDITTVYNKLAEMSYDTKTTGCAIKEFICNLSYPHYPFNGVSVNVIVYDSQLLGDIIHLLYDASTIGENNNKNNVVVFNFNLDTIEKYNYIAINGISFIEPAMALDIYYSLRFDICVHMQLSSTNENNKLHSILNCSTDKENYERAMKYIKSLM